MPLSSDDISNIREMINNLLSDTIRKVSDIEARVSNLSRDIESNKRDVAAIADLVKISPIKSIQPPDRSQPHPENADDANKDKRDMDAKWRRNLNGDKFDNIRTSENIDSKQREQQVVKDQNINDIESIKQNIDTLNSTVGQMKMKIENEIMKAVDKVNYIVDDNGIIDATHIEITVQDPVSIV